ncbi:hypothetical protein MLD38_014244 [Melastoma candidum]|uniref:Uncharacterized protein n=1 Tax=Melastoma candidum TaxID=119954 RepID=A0ACB9RGB8_9MYRT|nr:hypothetical protein MLD38_014244 [Melastoma candidum]
MNDHRLRHDPLKPRTFFPPDNYTINRVPFFSRLLSFHRFLTSSTSSFSSHRTLFYLLWIAAFGSLFLWQRNSLSGFSIFGGYAQVQSGGWAEFPRLRGWVFNVTEFGVVGDGVTVNTKAFERAVAMIARVGGGQLNVPPRHFLGLMHVSLQDERYWPLMPLLPSYGYGREHPGPRFGSLIHGQNLKDLIITGHHGTIHGKGQLWWKKYRQKLLNNTRGKFSAGISIGSEMSGGVSNVTVENVIVWDSRRAVRIKTAPGRGAYVRHIQYSNVTFENVRVGIVIKTDYKEDPDEGFDPKATPTIEDITFTGFHGQGVRVPVRIHGSEEIPIRNVTFRDMSVGLTYKKKHIFQCVFVQGQVLGT